MWITDACMEKIYFSKKRDTRYSAYRRGTTIITIVYIVYTRLKSIDISK